MDIFLQKFYKDFQEYTYKNQVLAAASGLAFGFATNQFLTNLVDNVFLPIIKSFIDYIALLSPIPHKYPLLWKILTIIFNIFWYFIIWIVTIFVSFFLIEYILNRQIIGMTSKIPEEEKQDYLKSKVQAKIKSNILPTEKDKQDIQNEESIIETQVLEEAYFV